MYINGTEINYDTVLNVLLFADDQVLLPDIEDNLQTALYTLHNTKKQFRMKISPLKSRFHSEIEFYTKEVQKGKEGHNFKFSPKTISTEIMQYFSYHITFTWL
jgi:hypothetical protein